MLECLCHLVLNLASSTGQIAGAFYGWKKIESPFKEQMNRLEMFPLCIYLSPSNPHSLSPAPKADTLTSTTPLLHDLRLKPTQPLLNDSHILYPPLLPSTGGTWARSR